MKTIGIIGAGAAGVMAAIQAARLGSPVILFEKNEKIGKKLYITGKGRCNLTNASPINSFMDHLYGQKEFLYAAFDAWSNEDTMAFFEDLGVKLKVERGQRVFPASDKSSDIIKALGKEMNRLAIDVRLHHEVKRIEQAEEGFRLIGNFGSVFVSQLIIATGGMSYPATGSTGDGYRFAQKWQIPIVDTEPGLCGFVLQRPYLTLAGLTLKNVALEMRENKKLIYRDQGELLFTHEGVSGPLALTASNLWSGEKNLQCSIDFKPALTKEMLDHRLINELTTNSAKELKTIMQHLLPKALIDPILSFAQIDPTQKCHETTKEERHAILETLKDFPLQIQGLAPIEQAIITRGGIDTNSLSSSTMESKQVKGLYFCGEILNIHGDTGGYNLQIAFSTGYLSGINATYALN